MKQVTKKRKKQELCPPKGIALGLAAAALPALILLLTYLVRGFLTHKGAYLIYSELDDEYLALIRFLKNPTSLTAFLPSAGGASAMRIAAFAASPFNHLIALAPLSSAGIAVALVSVLRAALSGLTFSYYLSGRRLPSYASLAFSTMYALSSYAVLMTYSIAYIDTMILFPLLMLGLERLVQGRRAALFASVLALSLLTNPLALIPLLLSSVIYVVYLSALQSKSARERLLDGACFLLGAAIASAAAAITLIPLLKTLIPDPSAYHFTTTLDILDLLAKALPGSYDGTADAHLPYLYVGIAPLLLAPVYFSSPRIPRRERIATGVLWFLLYFTFSIHSINGAWSGFVPTLPSYASALFFLFLLLIAAARAYTVLDGAAERTLLVSAGVLTVLVSVIQKLDLSYTVLGEDGKQEEIKYVSDVPALWLSLLFTVLLVATLVLLSRRGNAISKNGKRAAAAALLLAVSFEAFASASELIKLIDADEEYLRGSEFSVYERAYGAGAELLRDTPLYRFELTERRTESDSLFYRTPSLLDYDRGVLEALGIKTDKNGVAIDSASPLMLSLLGVRYYIQRETVEKYGKDGTLLPYYAAKLPDALRDLYKKVPSEGEGDAPTVYENESALPLLFPAPSGISDVVYSSSSTTLETVNSLFAALTEGGISPYIPATSSLWKSAVSEQVALDGYTVYEATPANGNVIEFRVTAEANGPLYLSLFTLYPRASTVNVHQVNHTLFEESESSTLGTVCLGEFEKGHTVTVRVKFDNSSDGRFYIPEGSTLFWQEDAEAADAALAELSSRTLSDIALQGGTLTGTVTAKDGEVLFTTLPSDGRWIVRVDGRRVQPAASLGCFLTIPLGSAGTHTVSLSRSCDAPVSLALIAPFGAVLLVCLAAAETYAKKTRRALPYYPERTAGGKAGKP